MEGNKIYFKDLFDPDVLEGLAKMKETLGNLSGSLNGLGDAVKSEASKVQAMMSAGNQSTEALAKLASTLERLCDIFDKWKAATDANKEAIDALKTSTKAQMEIDKEFCSTEKTKQALIQTETALIKKNEAAVRLATASARKLAAEQKKSSLSLKQYKDSLNKLNAKSEESISITGVMTSSFKDLSAAYSATVSKMKDMILAGETDNKVFQNLSTSAMMMHDKLDSINRSVGIYTMNVGNYKAAFDGLGFSLQQILREAPSAINLQQFLLAISNNIPIFLDQLSKANREIPKINKDLELLRKQRLVWYDMAHAVGATSKQIEEANVRVTELDKQISNLEKKGSIFRSITSTIFSWQTGALVLLTIITNWKKITELIKKAFGNTKVLTTSLRDARMEAERMYKVLKDGHSETATELKLLLGSLDSVKRGTSEWKDIIGRVNEITHANLNDTTATVKAVQDVTNAYIDQQKQLAVNKSIVELLQKEEMKKLNREYAQNDLIEGHTYDIDLYRQLTGISEGSKKDKDLVKLVNSAKSKYDLVNTLSKNKNDKWKQIGKYNSYASYVKGEGGNGGEVLSEDQYNFNKSVYEALASQAVLAKESLIEANKELKEFVDSQNKLASSGYLDKLKLKYKAVDDPAVSNHTPKDKATKKDNDLLERRAYEVEADNADDILERRIELIKAKIKQELFDTKEEYDKELSNLLFNNEHNFLGERTELWKKANGEELMVSKEFLEQLKKLDDNYTKVTKAKEEKEKLLIAEETKKQQIKIAKEQVKEIQKAEDVQMAALKNRVKTEEDEIYNNSIVIENMKKLNLELERLNDLKASKGEGDAGIGEIDDAIQKTTSDLDKMQQKLAWDKQLALPKNLGDVTGVKKWFSSKAKGSSEGILRNALGDEQYDSMSEPQRESAFNTWLENSIDAMGTWYNTSVGYIKDVMNAYVELQQAKVEAAEEATDAAKEQYDNEKALMEAGYANNMESAYKEYKEKQALQKKAEEESKRAQKAQLALDSVSQSSSLITAAAQLWQSLSAIPVVGSALAIAAISTMFGSFAGAKIMAAKATKYGDGTAQLIDYGGSHASGNDVPLGVDKNGNEERIERGEIKAVINRRAVGRLGASRIIDMINSMNDGTFVEDAVGTTRRNLSLSINSERHVVNLSNIEKSLGNIERSENEKRFIDGDFEVVKIGNYTKRIRRK